MDFMNRASRPAQPANQTVSPTGATPPAAHGSNRKADKDFSVHKISTVILLFSGTILVISLLWYIMLGKVSREDRLVDNKRMQAVFLNGGQVYFGRINELNGRFLRLSDIYYLRVNQQVQPDQQQNNSQQDISLVKLGCELHGPQDSMSINRDQVVFWENLKDDGQVAKAVVEYKKANPNGQKCETGQQGQGAQSGAQQQQQTQTTPAASPTPAATPAPAASGRR